MRSSEEDRETAQTCAICDEAIYPWSTVYPEHPDSGIKGPVCLACAEKPDPRAEAKR